MEAPAPDSTSSPVLLRYRDRDIRSDDLEFLRSFIEHKPSRNRIQLATAICEVWDWRQCNGGLSITACRDLLLKLHEWGYLELPSNQQKAPRTKRSLPILLPELIPLMWVDVGGELADLHSLVVRPITPEERQGWGIFMHRYHYLGYGTLVGEHILYAAFLKNLANEMVALIGWASAALRVPLREDYIGWDEDVKRSNLHMVVNNVRFLIPPWVRVKNLASKVLAANLRRLSADWQNVWGHPVYLAETFVDTSRFQGTCYQAANWTYLGHTAGRSKRGNAYLKGSNPKAYYIYPLHRNACQKLCSTTREDVYNAACSHQY